ncbi:Protein of unknown function (DUF1091) [Popillia japonica]|uniref:Uncharacterized protein n=1 Tax=Popillia japonica TaxID=7064 RepID=A0AAW1MYX3_POPJA
MLPNIQSQIEKRELQMNRNSRFTKEFTENDKVLFRMYDGKDKWKAGKIKRRLGRVNYEIDSEGKSFKRHANQMRQNFNHTNNIIPNLPQHPLNNTHPTTQNPTHIGENRPYANIENTTIQTEPEPQNTTCTFHQEDYETDLEYVKVAYVNPKYFQYYSLENVKPNRTYRAISGQTALLRDLGNTLKINIRGYKIVDNIPKVPIMQFDVLVCESFQKNILGLDVIRTKSTNITKCPIKKGFYFVQNFNVLAQHLPPFIPQGHYMLNLSLFEEKSLMAQVVAYGSLLIAETETQKYHGIDHGRGLQISPIVKNKYYCHLYKET